MKSKVLFLCTGNSCRSQMAEGWLRALAGDRFDAFSAGTHPSTVNPRAIQVMNDVGIDISNHHSDNVDQYLDTPFTYVITVCDNAKESCPVFPRQTTFINWSFVDPADAEGNEAEILSVFVEIRDQIKQQIEKFLQN